MTRVKEYRNKIENIFLESIIIHNRDILSTSYFSNFIYQKDAQVDLIEAIKRA
jgi:hypothetical protein